MTVMIRRGRNWMLWVLGLVCAALFGRGLPAVSAAENPERKDPPPPPPGGTEQPAEPAGALEDSADWKTVLDAWAFCGPLATSGKSTTAERKQADGKLKDAAAAADRLAEARLLAVAEAGLLKEEAAKIRADIYRNPPTDTRVTCYDMAMIPPAQQSLTRLRKRLPLLESLASSGKVHEPVMAKVLTTVEADLAVLGNEGQIKAMNEEQRTEAAELCRKAGAAVRKIRRVINPPPKGGGHSRPTCYLAPMPLDPPKPQSAIEVRRRLAEIDRLEEAGRLLPSVAGKLREGLRT